MAPAEDCFGHLPDEVLASIIERVGAMHELGNCFLVCKRWGRMANTLSRLEIDWQVTRWDAFRAIFGNRRLLSHLRIGSPCTSYTSRTRKVKDMLSTCLPACIELITCGLKSFELVLDVGGYPSCKVVLGAVFASQTKRTLEELVLKKLAFSIPADVIPSLTSTLPRLTYCKLFKIQMGSDTDLSKLLELSPNLVQLRLEYCTGLAWPVISSQSLRVLTLFWENWQLEQPDPRSAMSKLLVVNAPKLRRLELSSVKEVELQATARSLEMLALFSATAVTFKDEFSTTVEKLLLSCLSGCGHYKWTEEGITSTMSCFEVEEVQSVSILPPLPATSFLRPSRFFQGCQELTLGKEAYQCCRRVNIGSLKKITLVGIDRIKVDRLLKMEKGCMSLVDIVLAVGRKRLSISFTQKALQLQQSLSRAKLTLIESDRFVPAFH